jgi:cytochrome c-type biogenesis protein CcmH
LVNSYAAVGQFDKAAKLYGKLAESTELGSEEFARLKGVQAQSLFQASGESMTPAIQSLIDEALKADAEEPSSLMLQGINAYNSSNYKQAIAFWEKAKGKAGEDQITRFINPAIKSSQQKMGIATALKSSVKPNQKVAGGASLIIDLTLNKALKEKVNDDDIVFVFARPVGGRMPLAAERIKVKDLPARIVLDDTKAAMPTAKLSSVDVVEVTARVSKSGQPMAQKGDLFAEVKNIAVSGSVSIALDINQVVE